MGKTKLLLPLLMAIVMMAMSPTRMWAEDLDLDVDNGDNVTISNNAEYDNIYVREGGTLTIEEGVTVTVGEWCEFAVSGGTVIIKERATVTVGENGSFDVSGGTLTIENGATVTIGEGEYFSVYGGKTFNYGTINGGVYINVSNCFANHGTINGNVDGQGTWYNYGTVNGYCLNANYANCGHANTSSIAATCTHAGGTRCNECGKITYSGSPSAHTCSSYNADGIGVCTVCSGEAYEQPKQDSNDNYLIANTGNLYWFRDFVNTKTGNTYPNLSACAKLTANIVVNDGEFDENGNFTATGAGETSTPRTWDAIGVSAYSDPYTGTFDGDGHTISGLYCKDSKKQYFGLFRYCGNGAIVKGVGIVNCYFNCGYGNIGAICYKNYGTIDGCYSTGTITSTSNSNAGLCVDNYGTISNCYSTCSVTAPSGAYGICDGNRETGTLKNCYFAGSLSSSLSYSNKNSGICYQNLESATVTNCYTTYDKAIYNNLGTVAQVYPQGELSANAFSEGEIAYKLNGSVSSTGTWSAGTGTPVWYQKLGNDGDDYPVLKKASDGSNTVHKDGENYFNYTFTYSNVGYTGQEAGNAFDQDTNTKWCGNNTNGTDIYVEFNTTKAMKVGSYTFTTGDDTHDYAVRNPKTWTLKGKVNNSDTWTTIDTKTNSNKMPAFNKTAVTFYLSEATATAYKYFRIEFTHTKATTIQLSEISLSSTACPHTALTHHAAVSATCTKTGNNEYWTCNECGQYFNNANHSDESKTNAAGITTTDLGHDYNQETHLCTRCQDPEEGQIANGQGTEASPYQIATVADLMWLSRYVNAGKTGYNTAWYELTNDLDLSSVCHAKVDANSIAEANWTPIGTDSNPFKGKFNGQSHSITNMYIHYTTGSKGLFGKTNGATVKNFSIGGMMESSTSNSGATVQCIGGVIGWAYNSTVEDITSNVNIKLDGGITQKLMGGVVGDCDGTTISGCTYTGTLNAGATGDCVGGITGYFRCDSKTSKAYQIINCHNAGNVTTTANSNAVAGILGYSNDGKFMGAHNCLNTGKITTGASTRGAIYGTLNRDEASVGSNNYYKVGSATNGIITNNSGKDLTSVCTSVTLAQLTSGEVCHKLNGSRNEGTDESPLVWGQVLEADATPTLNGGGVDTYKRTNIKNKWGTLVVPFDVLADQEEYDLYSIISVEDEKLTLKRPEGILPAGTPVLIRMSEAGKDAETGKYNLHLEAANTTLKTTITNPAAVDGYTLKGSYDVKDITDENGYIISNNAFWNIQSIKGENKVYCSPFRAYLASTTTNNAKMLSIGWNEDEDITAVETLDALTSDEAQYYDINGRKLNDLQQGINIVKRGNKTYKILVK